MAVYSLKKACNQINGSYNNILKIHNERTANTYKCNCGHSVVMRPSEFKTLCYWCNKWVFKNKEDEFKYRLKEKMK